MILFGHLLFFQSWSLIVYLPLVFLLFRTIVVFHEDRTSVPFPVCITPPSTSLSCVCTVLTFSGTG